MCIDLVGKLPMSEGYQYLLTIVDRFTRYIQAIPLKDATGDSRVFRFSSRLGSVYGCSSELTVRPW